MTWTLLASHRAATPALLGAIAAQELAAKVHDDAVWAGLLSHPHLPGRCRDQLITLVTQASSRTPGPVVRALISAPCHTHAGLLTLLSDDDSRGPWIGHLREADPDQICDMQVLVAQHPGARHTLVPAMLEAASLDVRAAQVLARTLAMDPRPQPAARTWLTSTLERRAGPGAADLATDLAAATPDPQVAQDLLRVAEHMRRAPSGAQQDVAQDRADLPSTVPDAGSAQRGMTLPAATIRDPLLVDVAQRADLLAALGHLLPGLGTVSEAGTLLELVSSFHGTVAEVFTASRAVAA